MYHCLIVFYCIGCEGTVVKTLQSIPPLERFTHRFAESDRPRAELTAGADVILADLRNLDAGETLEALAAGMKPGAELILIAGKEQEERLAERAPDCVRDIWTAPLSEKTLRFRFLKWRDSYKLGRDLWQANSFLDTTINESPNLIWFKDKNGLHEKVNNRFCRTVNKTREQVEGQKHAYIWDVERDDPACAESEREVMERRTTCVRDEVVRTRDGEMMLTTYKSPLFDLDGSVMGTVGVAIDVTKERNYKQEILEKNRTMELLFATMDCGVMCHSLDGKRVISVNKAALKLLGYQSQQELLDDGFDLVAQSVLEEDRAKLREAIHALKKPGDSANVEYRVRHPDGKLFHILGNIKLIEKGGELFYQRFLLDFTAYKLRDEARWARKNQEIQYQERIFEIFSSFLAENVDDVYMMLDETGEAVEFVSSNIDRVLGIPWQSAKENLGCVQEAHYIAGGPVTRETLRNLEPGMSLENMETERINQKTGERRWFRESVYCVSVQYRKKIIVYISDRTRERVTQNTLAEALDMAQVANKAKSTFLSNVSHDIRTPMNAIMGFVTLLKEEAGDPERVLEYTQKISAASQHLLGLINDVLDMNKIESGSAVLNIGELNLAELIDGLNTMIRPQAKAKDQTFEMFTNSLTYEHLLGDKVRINQILINILSNAVKYTQTGGRIEMRVEELPQVDENYSRIQFTIRDNGQGMSEEYQRVIFDPFTREQSTALNKIQGTGLGMAITKSLVDLMGGKIRVESKSGRGSTFTVELELRIQKQEADPAFWEKHGIGRMIVADDDEDICRDIVRKMSRTGVVTHYATSGKKAVEMMRAAREEGEPYDLMLLDWKMPDLDGMETARLIRKHYSPKIPILLFTAYDWADIEKEALEVGIEHFLPKPFFMSNFKSAIQRMMGTQKSALSGGGKSVVDKKRIMVVDDIEVNRMILVKILTSLGAVCDTAEDGREAVEKFEASRPGEYDIILMDVQMPVMNGYEATRTIRAGTHPSAQSVAIIAMTANAFVDDIRSALESGMDAHVPKPIVLDQLKRTIQEVLERKEHKVCRILPQS